MKAKLFLLLFFTLSNYLRAQQDSVTIETIEVTASRIDGSSKDIGRDIQVISQQTIRDFSIHTVDEALKYLTGIDVQSRGPRGIQSDISLRGSTFNQVVVLIDGVRANDPLTGHFSMYLPVINSHIERIEIIKGSSSGIHGADAVGGVINIVTLKSFNSDRSNPNINLRLTGGSFGLKEGEVGLIGNLSNDITAGGGIIVNDTDGETYADSLNRRFSYLTYSTFANWNVNKKLNIGIRHAHDRRDFNAQYFYTRSTFDKSVEEVKRSWNQIHANYFVNDRSKIEIDALYARTHDDFLFNPLFTGNLHTTSSINSNLKYKRRGANLNWTFGLNYQNQKIESNDRGNHQFNRMGGYVIGLIKFTERISVLTGARLDYDENIGYALSPHISTSVELSDRVTLRSFAGRAVRSADFTEKYISNNLPGPLSAGRNIGNPNLKEERSWSFDIGIDAYPSKNIKLSSSLFYRTASDLIDFTLTPGTGIHNQALIDPSATYFYTKNISSLQNYGIELNVTANARLSKTSQIRFSWSATLQDQSSDTDDISKYISSSASALINQSILLDIRSWKFGWLSHYKHRDSDLADPINAQLESSYWINNLSLSRSIINDLLTIKVEATNVFDVAYSDILGAQLPGRWLEGSLYLRL